MPGKKQKKSQENINTRLQLVCKSGKYTLGHTSVLRSLRQGKAKAIIIANNCPALMKIELEYYSMLSKAKTHQYNGNNQDLATACGKYFRSSVMGIIEAGDTDILRVISGPQ